MPEPHAAGRPATAPVTKKVEVQPTARQTVVVPVPPPAEADVPSEGGEEVYSDDDFFPERPDSAIDDVVSEVGDAAAISYAAVASAVEEALRSSGEASRFVCHLTPFTCALYGRGYDAVGDTQPGPGGKRGNSRWHSLANGMSTSSAWLDVATSSRPEAARSATSTVAPAAALPTNQLGGRLPLEQKATCR